MRSWKEVRPGQLVCVGATCDRCGQNAKPFNANEAYGTVSVYVQGKGRDRYEADLCANCSDELVQWTRALGGRGVVEPTQLQRDMEAAERYKSLEIEVLETFRDIDSEMIDKIVKMARRRGAR